MDELNQDQPEYICVDTSTSNCLSIWETIDTSVAKLMGPQSHVQ